MADLGMGLDVMKDRQRETEPESHVSLVYLPSFPFVSFVLKETVIETELNIF